MAADNSVNLSLRAFHWVMRYCTWEGSDDAPPHPHAGKISSLAFNMLLMAAMVGKDAKTLPIVLITPDTFAGMTGKRDGSQQAAIDELVEAGLITARGKFWTLCIDEDVRP